MGSASEPSASESSAAENTVVAPINLMATCPKGLENLLGKELLALGAASIQESVAACYFTADLANVYKICLWSRLANRIILLLERARVNSDQEMYDTAFQLPWSSHFTEQQSLLVDFNGTSEFTRDARFGALRIKDAINDHFVNSGSSRLLIADELPDVVVYVRLFKGRISIGLDMVGESLHKRGYRSGGGAAPLKENLAAAMLIQCGWPAISQAGGSFVDPMCGSGTLLIEAALMAANIPPAFLRVRGFTGNSKWTHNHLLSFDAELWSRALQVLEQAVNNVAAQPPCAILGYDIDPRSIALTKDNLAMAGLTGWVQVKQCDIANLQLDSDLPTGLLLVNPPYGERLGEVEALKPVYAQLGQVLKRDCLDWQAGVFTGNTDLGWKTGLRSWRQHRLYNGGLECQLQRYRIEPKNFVEDNTERGKKILQFENLNENAQMLANRLRKNRKRLSAMIKANQHLCYRLYDADLPEYAVAIDCYPIVELFEADPDETKLGESKPDESLQNNIAKAHSTPNYYANAKSKFGVSKASSQRGKNAAASHQPGRSYRKPAPLGNRYSVEGQMVFHVQEYAAPPKVDGGLALRRIKDAVAAVSCVFECPLERIYLKQRERQKGGKQYQKLDESAPDMVIQESGHKLKVNLGRYLDTGVFLDHRPVRQRIASEINGKRFLNLYCYTASASVYAACAGAAQTVSVDMSNTYLQWSQHNFELNDIDMCSHHLVRADCSQWLANSNAIFDCILLDPPSFSNSKRMENTLDISRDQAELVNLAMKRLDKAGNLYFSNNKRGFKLAQEIIDGYDVIDITAKTLDRDFSRGRPAHQCWLIRHKA